MTARLPASAPLRHRQSAFRCYGGYGGLRGGGVEANPAAVVTGPGLATLTSGVTSADVRLRAFELGELFWEHDRLTLRSLNPARHRPRERLVRHAKRVQDLLESGATPAGDPAQQAAAKAVADLMQMLWEHARDEEANSATPAAKGVRVPPPQKSGRPRRGPFPRRRDQNSRKRRSRSRWRAAGVRASWNEPRWPQRWAGPCRKAGGT